MIIPWDEPKRLSNLDKHGFDFAALDEEFFLGSVVRPAQQGRFQAIGRLADGTISVVFAVPGTEGISMRPRQCQGKGPAVMKNKIRRQTEFKEGRGYTREDWDAVSDNPEWTAAELAKAKPFAEAFPELAETMRKNVGGRPRLDAPKRPVSIRLDPEVIELFKKDGPGWQSRINETLRKAVGLK